MEDLNAWVTTAASWLTLLKFGAWLVRKTLPKVRENLKMWRGYKRKR